MSVRDNFPVSTKSSVLSELTGTPTDTAPWMSEPVISTVSGISSAGAGCPCAQAAVKAASDARVYATAVDAPAIEGAEKPPPPPVATAWYGWPLKLVLAAMSPPPAVTVDHLVAESTGDLLPGDLRAIDTPGHTPGHASFLLDRDGGLVFVGDAARGTRDGRRVTRGFFNRPDPTLDESIRHLAELDFEVAVFGHSGPVRAGASSIFRSFAASLS
jgi:glyoxylase-like metal-dependent hydrolase (beta-lactamase superfamily II)